MRVTKKIPSECFWRKIGFLTKLFITKGSFFLRELLQLRKVNICNKTIRNLPAKRSYTVPFHQAVLRLPLPCISLFLDKSPRSGLPLSPHMAAAGQEGPCSPRWERCFGPACGQDTTGTWCRAKRAPAATQRECKVPLQLLVFTFSLIKARFPSGNSLSFFTCPSYCNPGMLEVLISRLCWAENKEHANKQHSFCSYSIGNPCLPSRKHICLGTQPCTRKWLHTRREKLKMTKKLQSCTGVLRISSPFPPKIYAQLFSSLHEHVLLILRDGWGRLGGRGECKGNWKTSATSISKTSLPLHRQSDF